VLAQSQQARRDHFAACLTLTAAWAQDKMDRIEWIRPDAGAICCVRLRPEVFDDAAAVRFFDVLANQGVRVASGAWFGDEARVHPGHGPSTTIGHERRTNPFLTDRV